MSFTRMSAAAVAAAILIIGGGAERARPAESAGALEVSLAGDPAFESLELYLKDRHETLEKGAAAHTFQDVPAGRYALTAEGPGSLLAVADVTVEGGKTTRTELVLRAVDDVDAFCASCHPPPGEEKGGQIPRDLHASGKKDGGEGLTCASCHTPHRPTPHTNYVVEPFREASTLCRRCHDRGHAGRLEGVENCSACHSLDSGEAQRGTSLISAASRSMPVMKSLNDGESPEVLGCTYCHGGGLESQSMVQVLSHFGPQTSKHPVGYDFKSRAETRNEYLSSTATSFSSELDCIDCHDPALLVAGGEENLSGPAPYANHADPEAEGRSGNRAMLRTGGADSLCRLCHGEGETFAKADLPEPPHGTGEIREPDGTPLRTSSCVDCHNSHSSSRPRLFSDGGQRGGAAGAGGTEGCTSVCHYRGDPEGSYDTHGHGMAAGTRKGTPMKFGCQVCHAVNSEHRSERPKMLIFPEGSALSSFGTSTTSVCHICHGQYKPHGGKGDATAGCGDCHDVHGEGVGPAGNRAMIPGLVPPGSEKGEATAFVGTTPGTFDFYNSSGDGLCDNATCHGGLKAPDGTPLVPLAGLMQGGHHSGGDKAPGTNCRECHSHGDGKGAWSAK